MRSDKFLYITKTFPKIYLINIRSWAFQKYNSKNKYLKKSKTNQYINKTILNKNQF